MTSSAPSHPASLARSLGAALCAVLAGACFALCLGLSWAQDHLLSPSGFQDTTASVVVEKQFQEQLVDTVLDRVSVGQDVHTGIGAVDDAVRGVRDSALDAVRSWLTATEQQGTWIRILDDTHDANVPLTPSAGSAPDELVVDAGPLGDAVDRKVQDTVGVSPNLSAQDLRITVPGAHTGRVLDALVWAAQWRYVLPWLAGGLAVLAVATAPRRPLALAGVGLAGLVCAGAMLAVVLSGARSVVDASAADPVAHLVTERVVTVLRDSFVGSTVTGMVWAAAVALLGVVVSVVRVRAVPYHGEHVHRG